MEKQFLESKARKIYRQSKPLKVTAIQQFIKHLPMKHNDN
jgi:hypothetical protein